tara:strand:+ start:394 stop:570 length:177 start_codon:yes stop_codon:yes gene_type:complete
MKSIKYKNPDVLIIKINLSFKNGIKRNVLTIIITINGKLKRVEPKLVDSTKEYIERTK